MDYEFKLRAKEYEAYHGRNAGHAENGAAPQDIRIVYRDIGMLDSQMEEGERPVHMVTLPQNIDELMKLLA